MKSLWPSLLLTLVTACAAAPLSQQHKTTPHSPSPDAQPSHVTTSTVTTSTQLVVPGPRSVPSAGRPLSLNDAQQLVESEFQQFLALPLSNCEALCKALASLRRAAERVCELAKEHSDGTQRCSQAQDAVKKAEERIRDAGCHCG